MLVFCPVCENPCSVAAAACPNCGHSLQAPTATPVVVQAPPTRKWSPGVAILLSFLIPGAGQLYKGDIFSGLAWSFFVFVGYFFLIIPGLVLHLICMIYAGIGDPYEGAQTTTPAARRQ